MSLSSTTHTTNIFYLVIQRPPISTLFPYTTLFRSFEHFVLPDGARLACVFLVPSPELRPESSLEHARSEEHTSELQSLTNLVCRLLLEKKKQKTYDQYHENSHATH